MLLFVLSYDAENFRLQGGEGVCCWFEKDTELVWLVKEDPVSATFLFRVVVVSLSSRLPVQNEQQAYRRLEA